METDDDKIAKIANEEEFDIPRSEEKLSGEMFSKYYDLSKKQKWLDKKQSELNYLIAECPSIDSQHLIIELLYNFTYLSTKKINKKIKKIKNHILNNLKASYENCIISALHNDNKADSAPLILQLLRKQMVEEEGWSENNFVNNIVSAADVAKTGDTIIIVDEFIGTGFQAERLLKRFETKIKNTQKEFTGIHMCVISRMKTSIERLSPFLNEYYSTIDLKKGITEYNNEENIHKKIKLMKEMEKSLSQNRSNQKWESLGKKQSETIYASDVGTAPANLFPIFWWKWNSEGNRRKNLLNRG